MTRLTSQAHSINVRVHSCDVTWYVQFTFGKDNTTCEGVLQRQIRSERGRQKTAFFRDEFGSVYIASGSIKVLWLVANKLGGLMRSFCGTIDVI